jgi:hypothetical protein
LFEPLSFYCTVFRAGTKFSILNGSIFKKKLALEPHYFSIPGAGALGFCDDVFWGVLGGETWHKNSPGGGENCRFIGLIFDHQLISES